MDIGSFYKNTGVYCDTILINKNFVIKIGNKVMDMKNYGKSYHIKFNLNSIISNPNFFSFDFAWECASYMQM